MLLSILKIFGIILLALLGIILTLLFLVLFVPVRYRLEVSRTAAKGSLETDTLVEAKIKITWLMHLLSVVFAYPEAAYIKASLFGFTVFKTGKEKKENGNGEQEEKEKKKAPKEGKERKKNIEAKEPGQEDGKSAAKEVPEVKKEGSMQEQNQEKESDREEKLPDSGEEDAPEESTGGAINKLKEFLSKILSLLRNIQYTITQICDKIKHIVNNIQYYIDIIKSETFSQAWRMCSRELLSLLKSIRPRKITGSLHIGTGDPASTGQVLAVYGILYPFLGGHIDVVPDFERKILEGELFIKGKITLFRLIKMAWVVYFNRDFRHLIKLFKREAV